MFIYFDDAFVKRIADNEESDNDKGFRTSLSLKSGSYVRIYPFNIHTELKEELKFPAITWKRYDRKYDVTRYVHDPQSELMSTTDENGTVIMLQYDAPKPYNFFYQLELRAKTQYDIDMMELWLEAHIDLRGDYVPVTAYIEETKNFGVFNFPLDLVEYQQMDEEENGNEVYRRIYSFKLSGLVDMNSFKPVDDSNVVNIAHDGLEVGITDDDSETKIVVKEVPEDG